jgi:glucose uptake protein GlcU
MGVPSLPRNGTAPDYWVPGSEGVALSLAILAMVAWGSWANLLKLNAGATRFEFFFLDYQAGALVSAVILTLCLGTAGFSTGLTGGRVLAALLAGAINTLGTLLVMASVELSGMTIVFPIVVGIEMAIGTTMLWLIERRESPGLLFTGVLCALCAVYLDYRSHNESSNDTSSGTSYNSSSSGGSGHGPRTDSGSLSYAALTVGGNPDDDFDEVEDDPFSSDLSDLNQPYKMGRRSRLSRKMAAASGVCSRLSDSMTQAQRGTAMCVLAAVFFSLWPVLDALSTEGCAADVKGSPFSFFLIFRLAALLFTWFVVTCMARLSISVESGRTLVNNNAAVGASMGDDPDAITLQNYLHEVPRRSRMLGMCAGAIWGVGTLCSLVAGEVVGLGVSMTLTRCSPLVATFWGVCMWKEADGMGPRAKQFLAGMVLFYILSIVFVSASAPSFTGAEMDGEAGGC